MTPALHDQILERLLADESIDSRAVTLVDAACQGAAKLDEALAKLGSAETSAKGDGPRQGKKVPVGAYLKRLELGGFRGIGPAVALEFQPGPGLTLLLGRNGSGKSSFAEGLETLLTAESRRWAERPKDWQRGWKNFHTDAGSFVEATFFVEGAEPIVLRRSWKADAALEDGELRVRRGSERLDAGLAALGWVEPLITFRPFLSHSELGALLTEPSRLHDELKSILGLEEITIATSLLAEAKKTRERQRKDVTERLKGLSEQLAAIDDPRAVKCREALSRRTWALDEVEGVVLGDGETASEDGVIMRLRRVSQVEGPKLDDVQAAASAARTALDKRATLSTASGEEGAKLAVLLEAALHHHAEAGGPCPVCARELPPDWVADTRLRLEEAKTRAADLRASTFEASRCERELRALIHPPPAVLSGLADLGLPDDAFVAWTAWAAAPADPTALCSQCEASALEVVAALESLRQAVDAKLATMESAWRPVARDLAAWLTGARQVEADQASLDVLKDAEKWMKDMEASLRDERFAPIAEQAQEIWALLRQESSVDLAAVRLEGTGTRRKVSLDVSVDGQEGVAVSVMSQGELNALALSLFLPRMTLAESPFHFVVVDDPVQAMDPHKVDGLARVLENVARTRQVIVLTHDTRLSEAVDRLGIKASMHEVARRARSVVEIRSVLDPVEQYLRDAWECLQQEEKIGPTMAARLVPGFCRLALEAACVESIRRRRLGRGDSHADVERVVAEARGVHPLAALAIEDDVTRGDRVFTYLKNKGGHAAADAFRAIKEGTHGGYTGSLAELLSDARKLAITLRSVR